MTRKYSLAFLLAKICGYEVLDIYRGYKGDKEDLFENEVYPIVYAYIDGVEKFSFVPELCSNGVKEFLDTRIGDIRTNVVNSKEELKNGEIFYITCIDDEKKLKPLMNKYKDKYHCVYQRDIYSGEQWFEIMPADASKSNAIKQLSKFLKCERIVVFGDGKNDIDMFEAADECYAVENADDELKKYAISIIKSNDEDGVAGWLNENYKEIT